MKFNPTNYSTFSTKNPLFLYKLIIFLFVNFPLINTIRIIWASMPMERQYSKSKVTS